MSPQGECLRTQVEKRSFVYKRNSRGGRRQSDSGRGEVGAQIRVSRHFTNRGGVSVPVINLLSLETLSSRPILTKLAAVSKKKMREKSNCCFSSTQRTKVKP